MPNYGKFLKELISNKHKIEQIYAAFLSDESSVILQNKVSPTLGDPGSFLIPCNFNKTFSCNALADLGASINLMPYSLYAKLSLENLKPTKMSVRLADRSFQYPVRIAKNMLVEVVIRVKQKQLNIGVGAERMIFNIDSAIKHSYLNDDTCFSINVIDEILKEDFDALLDEGSQNPPFHQSCRSSLVDCGDGDWLDGCVGLKCDEGNIGLARFAGYNVMMLLVVDENDVIEAVKVVVYYSGWV
ncbi:reverse transcriptase domain-containing protein [Tanacetum coccineum]